MRSKKTMATYPPSAAKVADQAAKLAGKMYYKSGRPPKHFDWSTVTPVARAAAIAAFEKRKKS